MRPDPASPDEALLDAVQRAGFGYFWDHAHPVSKLARDRSTRDVVTIGGTGMGLMVLIVACQRGFVARSAAIERINAMLKFLAGCERHHGMWGHFHDGASGRIVPFSPLDDGADLVETALLAAGLLALREYFTGPSEEEQALRSLADRLWREIDWTTHRQPTEECLFWHWSPRHGFAMNHRVTGWNECMIAYVLAAGSPTCPVPPEAYHRGWTAGRQFRNGATYFGYDLPLGPPMGGPLFFAHYSFLGLDPRGLADAYADYWQQNTHHTMINRTYCIANPKGFAGYGEDCWGLTASDGVAGYSAHGPDNDLGVIAPTAALSSMPYAPQAALAVLRHLLANYPDLWGDWGFRDAMHPAAGWMAEATLAIDQGPIVIMIENYRSGLIWRLVMAAAEVRAGLARLGFASPWLTPAVA
ncbi:MAG: beta-glucosidase [Rhizobiales bacterium]|nr:beta-glucosidase [Hyphomicrobiales bacterium]MBI3674847.1 beta-glucosidase [Hyphomicrobiales bacterium]